MSGYRVGVDIGGTFTDIVLMDEEGNVLTKKISLASTITRKRLLTAWTKFSPTSSGHDVLEILHGTTVASNAILEHRVRRPASLEPKGSGIS